MKKIGPLSCVVIGLLLCTVWTIVAADYGDHVVTGRYHFSQNNQTSTLILRSDHTFRQSLNYAGRSEHVNGSWRRVGEGGISFSKEFLPVSGQEAEPNGTVFCDIHKELGLFVALALRQYHVLWFSRVDSSPVNTVYGTYKGDDPSSAETLMLRADHTFEQSVSHPGVEKRAVGSWSYGQGGTIVFSRAFLKTSGDALKDNETASAGNSQDSVLQIEIASTSKIGAPIFRKRYFSW